jgi:hypothetical protein
MQHFVHPGEWADAEFRSGMPRAVKRIFNHRLYPVGEIAMKLADAMCSGERLFDVKPSKFAG